MMRILPVVVALALAAPGAVWAQGARSTRLNAAGPGLTAPGPLSGAPPQIGGEAAGITPGATPPPAGNTALGGGMAPGATPGLNSGAPDAPGAGNQPMQPGANSFTMGQAAARIQKQGFTSVTGLRKDDQGVWHGRAMRNGHPASVSLDYRGKVAGGQGSVAGPEAGRPHQGEAR